MTYTYKRDLLRLVSLEVGRSVRRGSRCIICAILGLTCAKWCRLGCETAKSELSVLSGACFARNGPAWLVDTTERGMQTIYVLVCENRPCFNSRQQRHGQGELFMPFGVCFAPKALRMQHEGACRRERECICENLSTGWVNLACKLSIVIWRSDLDLNDGFGLALARHNALIYAIFGLICAKRLRFRAQGTWKFEGIICTIWGLVCAKHPHLGCRYSETKINATSSARIQ